MSSYRIQVWDLPTRLFHWLLLGLTAAAIVSVKIGGNAMVWHGRFGHLIVGLIAFRIAWGFVGSSTARFAYFVRGPAAIRDYLAGRWHGVGHNPLGALSVLALLGAIGFQAMTGLFANDDVAFSGPLRAAVTSGTSNLLSGWHRQMEWILYGLIALHVVAVLYHVLVRKDALVLPMVTGTKSLDAPPAEALRCAGWLALGFALAVAGIVLWLTGGGLLPPPPPSSPDPGW